MSTQDKPKITLNVAWPRPQFGQRIKANGIVRKCHRYDPIVRKYFTRWEKWPWPERVEGIYIGYRTVREGLIEYVSPEEGRVFVSERMITVYLIVPNERTNPVRVLPEDVIWEAR